VEDGVSSIRMKESYQVIVKKFIYNKLGREPWRNCPKGLLSRVSRYCVKIMSGFLSYDFFSIIFYIYTMGVLK
jgi:hypothetical protein